MHPSSAPRHPAELPDDMRLPDGQVLASLDQMLDAARAEVHRWRHANESRTRREYGHGSMHPRTYAAGLQARLSIFATLWRIKHPIAAHGAANHPGEKAA